MTAGTSPPQAPHVAPGLGHLRVHVVLWGPGLVLPSFPSPSSRRCFSAHLPAWPRPHGCGALCPTCRSSPCHGISKLAEAAICGAARILTEVVKHSWVHTAHGVLHVCPFSSRTLLPCHPLWVQPFSWFLKPLTGLSPFPYFSSDSMGMLWGQRQSPIEVQ